MLHKLTSLQGQLSQIKRQAKTEYEAFVLGEMGKTEYLEAKAVFREREETLSVQISKLEASLEKSRMDMIWKPCIMESFIPVKR